MVINQGNHVLILVWVTKQTRVFNCFDSNRWWFKLDHRWCHWRSHVSHMSYLSYVLLIQLLVLNCSIYYLEKPISTQIWIINIINLPFSKISPCSCLFLKSMFLLLLLFLLFRFFCFYHVFFKLLVGLSVLFKLANHLFPVTDDLLSFCIDLLIFFNHFYYHIPYFYIFGLFRYILKLTKLFDCRGQIFYDIVNNFTNTFLLQNFNGNRQFLDQIKQIP